MILLLLTVFLCFLIGFLATRLCGDGLLTLLCIMVGTVAVYLACNPMIIKDAYSAPLGFYSISALLIWHIVPYSIFSFFPSLAGHSLQLLLKRRKK